MSLPLIVLVDDDWDYLEINRLALSAAGYRVETFFDADHAWQFLQHNTPHAVITDLMMGALDSGFALCKRIKADSRLASVPVVVVTAMRAETGIDFEPRSEGDLAAMHADGFLHKPLSPAALTAVVARLVRQESP